MRQSQAESSSGGSKGGRGPRGGRGGGPGGGGASASEQQLGIVNPSTGEFREPSPTSDTSQTPDWSPSGEQIVFRGLLGLQVESADGKESFQLTSDMWDNTPVWSPDGSKVAFIHRQHDHWEIYVVDVASGKQTRLTDTPAPSDGTVTSSVSPAWSPDGNYIAFFTDRTGKWEIWLMRADGSNQKSMFDTELDGLTLQYSFNSERAISWTK